MSLKDTPDVLNRVFQEHQVSSADVPPSHRYLVGGDHYTRCAIQPFEIVRRNSLDYWEGNVVRYILRHRWKNGLEDILKLKQHVEYIIEHYEELYGRNTKNAS